MPVPANMSVGSYSDSLVGRSGGLDGGPMLPGVPGVSAGGAEGLGAMGVIVAAVYGAGAGEMGGGDKCEARASGGPGATWPFVCGFGLKLPA